MTGFTDRRRKGGESPGFELIEKTASCFGVSLDLNVHINFDLVIKHITDKAKSKRFLTLNQNLRMSFYSSNTGYILYMQNDVAGAKANRKYITFFADS